MFYTGDLQSGIAAALRDSKMVACFVKDNGEESKAWEEDWLKADEVAEMLSVKAVLLKLQEGSRDASYLAAICPIPKTPTLVIIHNGQLKEYIISGVTREAFVSRLNAVLKGVSTPAKADVESPQEPSETHGSGPPQTAAATLSSAGAQSSIHPTASSATTPSTPSESTQHRLEAHHTPVEPRRQSDSAPNHDHENGVKPTETQAKKSGDADHAVLLKKRQKEAREERARILKRVEDDKVERRKKDAERKAEMTAEKNGGLNSTDATSSTIPSSSSEECAVQVRLFDGSTIRSRFSSSNTLRTDVRRWIAEQKEVNDTPYSFRQVLTPHPNRIISIHEEEETLQSIGLTPSATLILVPIKEYATAYGASQQGLLSKSATAGYNLVSSGIGLVTGAFGNFLTRSEGTTSSDLDAQQTRVPPNSVSNPNARVRTLRDQRDTQEDQQLYNGNTLNFEPRRDREDDKTE